MDGNQAVVCDGTGDWSLIVSVCLTPKLRLTLQPLEIVESNMASQLEEQAFALLRSRIPRFYVPNLKERKQVLTWLGMSSKFVRSFDALQLNVEKFDDASGLADFSLIEIKVTEKELPRLNEDPTGFFFGMTDNEEMLLRIFEGKSSLCLVSVNPLSPGYFMLSWGDLQRLDLNKRIQYQINIR